MKRLNRLLLIHWYTYDQEIIEFGDLNFLTGKTASGKSTIIDALQLVLLGETSGSIFNKAANKDSRRTLKSYLYGENGDDGDAGFRYLRKGPFTSYVVAEFEDTVKHTFFLNGIVCDCYGDLNFEYKWFLVNRSAIPEDRFIDKKTGIPLDIAALRTYLKQHARNNHEIIDRNKRYQDMILSRYGSVKRKYLTLLKKAVPFTPITDIEQFITESICDVKNNIQVEQMQSDIRHYKNLEADAIRTEKRIEDLTKISEITRQYETQKDRYRQQGYVILRARQSEQENVCACLNREIETRRDTIGCIEKTLNQDIHEQEMLGQEIESLETEYHTSDILKKQRSLEDSIQKQEYAIRNVREGVEKAQKAVKDYAGRWLKTLDQVKDTGFQIPSEHVEELFRLIELPKLKKEDPDFLQMAHMLDSLREQASEYEFQLKSRSSQIKEALTELQTRIENLEKGIKPYPRQVTGLKHALEKGLFDQYGKTVHVHILADLLEIKDPAWRNAVEGYLDRQKFYLLVPGNYYKDAVKIYHELRREERIYDAGIVDVKKLRETARVRVAQGSLAEEIETDHADARLYVDYLLGRVMKCDNVAELNQYPVSITKDVMLYKSFVSRRLDPARYANPFIGRRSMEILLEQLCRDYDTSKKEYDSVLNAYRLMGKASSCSVMSEFEAQQHIHAVEEATGISEMEERLQTLRAEYGLIDFTWLNMLKTKIAEKKKTLRDLMDVIIKNREEIVRLTEQVRHYEESELPRAQAQLEEVRLQITAEYDQTWIEETGEPKFQKEQASEHRNQLSLRESFERARVQTQTQMDNHRKERTRKRSEYNQEYRMPYDVEREDNEEYDKELHTLKDIRLPDYIEQIKDAKVKAYDQFRDDFIAKLKSNIESVKEQIEELNYSLKNSVFGTDRYRFTMSPRPEYRSYYDMITDPLLLDTGGWNITSDQFNRKYQKEIDSLFKALIINETDVSAERRAEYEKSIRKFTDYKTYLVFDLIVTNEQGEEQRLSRTLLKKSGGETQIPFYISLLASFSQICRIRSKNNNNTIRLIILDEAFSKMDGERIKESIQLLKRFGLQAIFSAPPEKTPDIAPAVDRNIVVFRSGHHSFTRNFDPAEVQEEADDEVLLQDE